MMRVPFDAAITRYSYCIGWLFAPSAWMSNESCGYVRRSFVVARRCGHCTRACGEGGRESGGEGESDFRSNVTGGKCVKLLALFQPGEPIGDGQTKKVPRWLLSHFMFHSTFYHAQFQRCVAYVINIHPQTVRARSIAIIY